MSDEVITRLRAESSRGDYASMARLARALYDAGLGPREVLRRCYGVDLPEEFFVMVETFYVVADAGPRMGLFITCSNQPWELAIPPDRSGLQPVPHDMDDIEQMIFARDADLVPLALVHQSSRWVDFVLCYRLVELKAGRTTVFGIREKFTPLDEVVRCGESLLAVLHEHHADVLRGVERQFFHPSNRGAGSIDQQELDETRSLVGRVEELQRIVAARQA